MNVLSLCDGISCGQIALNRAGINYNKYYASEIALPKIKAAQNAYPNTIQIGDITEIDGRKYKGKIKLLMAGTPCQGFSFMGKQLKFKDERSKLIFDFFRILKDSEPEYFLLENVLMDKSTINCISKELNTLPIRINSSLLSAQNRDRIYWTNIPGKGNGLFQSIIEQPEDKGIMLKDILQIEDKVDEKYYLKDRNLERIVERINDNEKYCKLNGRKARTVLESYGDSYNGTFICSELFNIYKSGGAAGRVYDPNYKSCTLKAEGGGGGAKTGLYLTDKRIRKLTPIECCRLQTVPDDYFDGSGLSDNQVYSCLGDGWTIDVIVHILKHIL